jgi:cold shock CspA family protein
VKDWLGAGPGGTDYRSGLVEAFDRDVGLGTVREGATAYPFHCTQISDGSRNIATGTAVTFVVVAGRGGRWEAGAITPAGGGTPR